MKVRATLLLLVLLATATTANAAIYTIFGRPTAPSTWTSLDGSNTQAQLDWLYERWQYEAFCAERMGEAYAGCSDELEDEELSGIVEFVEGMIETERFLAKTNRQDFDEQTEFEWKLFYASQRVHQLFAAKNKKLSWYQTSYVCRHHTVALLAVLSGLGIEGSYECGEAGDALVTSHAWAEATFGDDTYLLDALNGINVRIESTPQLQSGPTIDE